MKAVVLNKYKGVYMLRHIIYDIDDTDTVDTIKDKYYESYNRTDTNEFILCDTKENVNAVLSSHGIKSAYLIE